MTTPVLPDVDDLIRKAFDADTRLAAQVFTLWPGDWYERMPLVVARRVSGAAPDSRFLDAALVDVQVCASGRDTASLLARTARAALWDACTVQFSDTAAGGYLSRLTDEFAGPAELRTGTPASQHSDVFVFQATYEVQARPLPAP